jgi:hypothetical protein
MQMVHRMAKRAAYLAPVIILALTIIAGPRAGLSGAIGIAMTLANLWFSARIIGGIADNNPSLLLIAAMGAFTLGLALMGGAAFGLEALDIADFATVGFTLIGTHMVLVIAEFATAYPISKPDRSDKIANARS